MEIVRKEIIRPHFKRISSFGICQIISLYCRCTTSCCNFITEIAIVVCILVNQCYIISHTTCTIEHIFPVINSWQTPRSTNNSMGRCPTCYNLHGRFTIIVASTTSFGCPYKTTSWRILQCDGKAMRTIRGRTHVCYHRFLCHTIWQRSANSIDVAITAYQRTDVLRSGFTGSTGCWCWCFTGWRGAIPFAKDFFTRG